jgi:hypothetical protein
MTAACGYVNCKVELRVSIQGSTVSLHGSRVSLNVFR